MNKMFETVIPTLVAAMPWLAEGALITVATVVASLLIGFCLGLPFAVLQAYGGTFSRRIVAFYVWFFRGVPILVLLYLFYFGLAYQFSLPISPFSASCVVLGLTSTAYQSQIFRGTIQSLPEGQMRAATALGMSTFQAICTIILPQALRRSIPGWSNEFSIILKDSALVSVLGTMELMARTKALATRTSEYTGFYIAAALLYFFITLVGVRGLKLLEKIFYIPGYTRNR